jgi:hypothetical protein
MRDIQILTCATIANLDCNVPWIRRRWKRETYMEILAAVVKDVCTRTQLWRGIYEINGTNIDMIVRWVENAYNVTLYQEMGSPLSIHPENTPRCPSCGSYLHLRWNFWNSITRESLGWRCKDYKERGCEDIMKRLWYNRCPPIVTPHKVFFHNWELDGHEIPQEMMVRPLTTWSLTRHYINKGEGMVGRSKLEIVRGRGHKLLNDEMESLLSRSYSEFGPAAVMLQYPDKDVPPAKRWNKICMRAGKMGLRQNVGAPVKKLKKLIGT